MSEIFTQQVTIPTTGSAGSAIGSAYITGAHGFLLDVKLTYDADCPATADVTISDATFGNIVVVTNNATDVWLMPRKQSCDAAAADTGSYELIPVNSSLLINVAQADELAECLTATVRWMTP
jgi:hypothetical protein